MSLHKPTYERFEIIWYLLVTMETDAFLVTVTDSGKPCDKSCKAFDTGTGSIKVICTPFKYFIHVLLKLCTQLNHHWVELCSVPLAQLHNALKSVFQSVNSNSQYNWRGRLAWLKNLQRLGDEANYSPRVCILLCCRGAGFSALCWFNVESTCDCQLTKQIELN
jgi:hypothetical protein